MNKLTERSYGEESDKHIGKQYHEIHQGGHTPQLEFKTKNLFVAHARPTVKPAPKQKSPRRNLQRIP